jgi:hypothetical protein
MLSRHTNNKLKSTIHQVVNPPEGLWGTSRYSVPFFMHPVSDMPLNCLENCVDAENPKFEDITAGDLYERLVDLGLIKVIFKIHLICRKTLGASLMSFYLILKLSFMNLK